MAEINTVIAEASQDLQTIEDFVNLPAGSDVRPRLLPSVNVGTLAGTRDAIFEAGGLPATPFATKALMTASALVDGKYAQVTDDTVNNGLYVKTAGAWVKSAYDPLNLAKSYTDNQVKGVTNNFKTKALMASSTLPNDSYAMVTEDTEANNGLYVKTAGAWVKAAYDPVAQAKAYTDLQSVKVNDLSAKVFGTDAVPKPSSHTLSYGYITTGGVIGGKTNQTDYQYTSPIFLEKGWTISFDYYGAGLTALATTNAGLTAATPVILMDSKPENSKRRASYTATEDTYVVASSKTSVGALNLVVELAGIKSITDGFISTSNIAYDVNAIATPEKVSSLEVSQAIKAEIGELKQYVMPTEQVPAVFESGYYQWSTAYEITDQTVSSIEFTLQAGDELSFDYTPINGTTLWEYKGGTQIGWVLLASLTNSSEVKSHTITASYAMTVRLTNSVEGTVKVNGVEPTSIDLGSWGYVQYLIRATLATSTRSLGFEVKKGDVITITKPLKGTVAVISPITAAPYRQSLYGYSDKQSGAEPITWVAPEDAVIAVCGHIDSDFLITRKGESLDSKFANTINPHYIPDTLVLPPVETVFATAMNYILKTELIDGVDYIKISTDLGRTWTQTPNILGDIVSYHFFGDGTIMLCSPTKVYWTTDYVTLNESVIYDHNGSIFVPKARHFFAMQTGDSVSYIGDTEVFAWGDYLLGGDVPRIWYSVDNGRTIKCAAKFGTTVMDGSVRPARHVHRVYFHRASKDFYITTGDADTECHIMRANYDVETDTWTWKVFATGSEYKFGNIFIDDTPFAYLVTDYTAAELKPKRGVYRVALKHLDDITKYQRIYDATGDGWGTIAAVVMFADNNGNKVIQPDVAGVGYLWLARDGMDFKRVNVSPQVLLAYVIGENYQGDIYCVSYPSSAEPNQSAQLKLNRGTYNITKAMRQNGVDNFMRGNTLEGGTRGILG